MENSRIMTNTTDSQDLVFSNVENREWRPMFQQFMDAGKEMCYEINAPQTSGFGTLVVTQKNGKRYGTYFAFIKDFRSRKNLRISWYSQVTKVGTCRMRKGVSDPKAVLDSKLRVLKTKGLRVADASIMMDIINGNTNAPSVMIGEKAYPT